MADKKITQLPASTVPLAGTEVLPIVQGGVTKQVSVASLTAGRAISATEATLTTGNLVIGTFGKGIDFSATASTGTSKLLADYEEGTWTPTLISTGTAPTIGYSTQIGNYVKVGKLVHWSVEIITSSATGGTGDLLIGGFPYVVGVSRYTGGGCAGYADNWTTRAPEFAYLYQGNSIAYLTAGGTTSSAVLTVSNLTNGAMTLIMSGTYISA